MENHGALVGWTHQDTPAQILLRLERVKTVEDGRRLDPDMLRLLMTKQQAALLGNYLIQASGLRPAEPRARTWLARMFG